jgi:hypothetical protein
VSVAVRPSGSFFSPPLPPLFSSHSVSPTPPPPSFRSPRSNPPPTVFSSAFRLSRGSHCIIATSLSPPFSCFALCGLYCCCCFLLPRFAGLNVLKASEYPVCVGRRGEAVVLLDVRERAIKKPHLWCFPPVCIYILSRRLLWFVFIIILYGSPLFAASQTSAVTA